MDFAEAPKKRHHPDGQLSSSLSKRLFTLCRASSVYSDDAAVACSDAFVKLGDHLSSREDTHFCISKYRISELSSTMPELTIIVGESPTENTNGFGSCKGSWFTNLDPAKCMRSQPSEVTENLGHLVDCSPYSDYASSGKSVSSNFSYRWNRNWEHWKRHSTPKDARVRGEQKRHLFSSRQRKTCDMAWIARFSRPSTWTCLEDKTGSTCGGPNEDDLFAGTDVFQANRGSLILGIFTEFQSAGLSSAIRRNISMSLDERNRGKAMQYQENMENKSGDDIRVEEKKGFQETDSEAIFTLISDEIKDATIDPSYILAGADDAGLDGPALTIDHDFEDYFSELLLM